MTWKPSTHDLDLIAELAAARAPTDQIAAALGLELAVFREWLRRMHAAKIWGETLPEFPPGCTLELPETDRDRIDRLFAKP